MMRSYAIEPETMTLDIRADSITHPVDIAARCSCGENAALFADSERGYVDCAVGGNGIGEIRDERDVAVFVVHHSLAAICPYFRNIKRPAQHGLLGREA